MSYLKVNELVGKTLVRVIKDDAHDVITFVTDTGDIYRMHHHHDCCESVTIEDVCGDLDDLVGTPILMAEEATSHDEVYTKNPHAETLLKARFLQGSKLPEIREYKEDSETWTFYRFRTIKGSVDIRWYGTSNGYYSESVTFELLTGGENE